MARRAERSRGRPAARRRGFTLIEVLVALAIVAISLGAGLRAAGALVDGAQRQLDVTLGHWCADNALTALRLARQFPGIGETGAECVQLGRAYRVTLKVQGTPNPNFRRVDALVADDQGRTVATLVALQGRE